MIELLGITLAAAVISDIKTRKIPNKIIALGILLSLISIDYHDPLKYFSYNTIGIFFGLLSLIPLYVIRACGAGDVKLMAMVGSFVGPDVVLSAAIYTLISGGILSVVFMLKQGVARKTFANTHFLLTDWLFRLRTGGGTKLAPLENTAARLPYAVAIAMGTGAAVWMQHH